MGLFLFSLMNPLASNVSAQGNGEITILHTAVNPSNNNTYHLLSAASWEDSAFAARGLDGFLTTVDDLEENQWIFDTFANHDGQSRHLWTGLTDVDEEGFYKWHDGTPFYYRNWGQDQPSSNSDEDFVHIAGTNIGNIMPGTWNDLSNDPELVPVYGVVEIGTGADYALRFDGIDDFIISDEQFPDWEGHIEIEAMINMPDISGINFITMMGDYGWGLYVINGNIAYSNQYSMSQNPVSNMSITENNWTHVKVIVEENSFVEFFIDGISAGTFDSQKATIPIGDFGSNSCFQDGLECDELYIGRMGAGCDCNYFMGMIDDVVISNAANESSWQFQEGEGPQTVDNSSRNGNISGASWVMPDGSIVTQAIQIFNGVEVEDISGMPGDQLLFFAEIDEMTKAAYLNVFSDFGEFWFEEEAEFEIYISHEDIPNSWDYDFLLEPEWGFIFEEWDWPEDGTWWFVIVPLKEVSSLSLFLDWDVADPPPPLEEMTELINAIPVTDQSITGGRQKPVEERILYYYVNVTENLSSLSVKTYGGSGNVDLGISWGTVPDPFNNFGIFTEPFEDDFSSDPNDMSGKIDWDGGQGNDQVVTLYDIEPGIYYIAAYTYQNAKEFTIVSQLTYQPDNIEPEDAIELTPGIEYGPLSGYNGLMQYFKIDVPIGTERLEVDLSKGFGEASLFMKIEQAPTSSDFTYLSSSPGAGDKIGFNDPIPGMWYILLETEEVFGSVMITASFEDRYVWSYDGTPIEMFNNEEISGIEAPEGEELFFFLNLEKPGDYLEISTFGGSGELSIIVEGKQMLFGFDDDFFFEFDEEMGRQRPNPETSTEDFEIESFGDGTEQSIYIFMPANGRFDILVEAYTEISDVTIVANWVYSDFLEPIIIDPIEEPTVKDSCRDVANQMMKEIDSDSNGVIDGDEFNNLDFDDESNEFASVDSNGDGKIEFTELLQKTCDCDNELWIVFDQLSNENQPISIELLTSQIYENKYDFIEMDTNSDMKISETEVEIASLICETTFDAFDSDGDGVPDVDDEFPNDPDESKDSDGDGVGDNADIAPSVANDLVYSIGALVFVGLLALLVVFARGNRGNLNSNEWDNDKNFDITETMLAMQEPDLPQPMSQNMESSNSIYQSSFDNVEREQVSFQQPPEQQIIAPENVSKIPVTSFEELLNEEVNVDAPPKQIMGMIGMDGSESIEYPINSGVKWTRSNPSDEWTKY